MVPKIIAACHTPYFDNIGIITKCHDTCGINVLGQMFGPEDAVLMGPRRLSIACETMYEHYIFNGRRQQTSR